MFSIRDNAEIKAAISKSLNNAF